MQKRPDGFTAENRTHATHQQTQRAVGSISLRGPMQSAILKGTIGTYNTNEFPQLLMGSAFISNSAHAF